MHTKPLTITEAAAVLGVHANTLRKWTDLGLVPYLRLPTGYRRFTPEQLDAIKARMTQEEHVIMAGGAHP